MKNFRSYGFWVALSSAVVVLLNALGRAFGFSIQNQIVEDVIMAVASLLVVLGVVNMNTQNKTPNQNLDEDQNLENDEMIEEENCDKDAKTEKEQEANSGAKQSENSTKEECDKAEKSE